MRAVSKELTIAYQIHDNWTEILTGTYFILNGPLQEENKKIPAIILTRTVIILSHQLVEVMFFNVVQKYINNHGSQISEEDHAKIKKGFDDRIGIKDAMKEWPSLLVGRSFNRSQEPFSSQEQLRLLRNKSIHWPSRSSVVDLAHSAYYTGVGASESIYSHFFAWERSEYSKYVKRYSPCTNTYLVREMQKKLK